MKLRLAPRLEQQQVLAPQMILSMDILLLSSIDLENRIEREFMENPALELDEKLGQPDAEPAAEKRDPEVEQLLDKLDAFERRYGGDERPRARVGGEDDAKHEALQNHADRPSGLLGHLSEQVGYLDLDVEMTRLCRELAGNIDRRGFLMGTLEEFAVALGISEESAGEALTLLQSLDPRGVGARDLRECLLLQLGEDDVLERRIIDQHLEDLLENRLPKLATTLGIPMAELKDAVEVISTLDPSPGGSFAPSSNGPVIPEIFADEIDGKFKVRMEEGVFPTLRISPACSAMLRTAGENPKVVEFVRRKIEAARWLIHAIDQRRRTLMDIAQAIVDHQDAYFKEGPGHLSALTMKVIAEQVGVHVSTVSRATNGKYIQTPYGVMELRRFFTGGVERATGGIESRDNVFAMIREIIEQENPHRPLSDSMLTRKLQEKGLDIARRTVTKYRERAGVAPARLRKKH